MAHDFAAKRRSRLRKLIRHTELKDSTWQTCRASIATSQQLQRQQVQHDSSNIRTKASNDFEAYWLGLKKDGRVPDIRSFDPLVIAALVPNLLVVEVSDQPRKMLVKMTGSLFPQKNGIEITGRDLRELFDESDREVLWIGTMLMIEHPCGLVQTNQAHYANGTAAITQSTILPFSSREHGVSYNISVSEWLGYASKHEIHLPVLLRQTERLEWLDLGYGTPDL